MKKIISFCLYGTNATYILGMKENILLASQYFPEWIVRIYYNSTVPEKYIDEFKNLKAECILKENLGKNKMNWEGMFWRWMPLDDNDVAIWISRDADSRLSEREAKIVKEWEESGKTLHSIRDHRCHMHCIMGGMFGVNNTLFHSRYTFDKVEDIIKNNISIYNERPYNVDQEFLNKHLWDLLKDDMMAHISNQGRRVYDSDIEIPSDPYFIGKQYRIDDFPENKLKYINGKKGCYWKKKNSSSVYWSNSTTNISPDVSFSSEGEFYNHRSDHGYPQNWSQINILDGVHIQDKSQDNINPLISIAISTYEANGMGCELLEHNLKHIMLQSYSNIEIVISDHSSDYKIKDLCEQYNNVKYPIKYIHNPEHKGNSSQNTNNAIKYCNGEYIKILFMDDYLYNENAISKIVSQFQSNPDKKWLVHSYIHTKNYKDFYNLHHPKISNNIIFSNRIGCPSCLTIHSSVTERFDDDLKWFMDSELYSRIRDKYSDPIILHTNANDKAYMVNLHHENQVTNTSIDNLLIQKEKEYINNKINLKLLKSNKDELNIEDFKKDNLNIPELRNKLTTLQNKLKLKYGNWNDEYEEQILSLNYIKSDSCVLELGGNIGRNSMIISLLLDDPTRLVVIEPSTKIYEQLMENKNNNNLNFNTECLAISEKRLWSSKWNTFSEYKPGSEEVDTISFDKLKERYQYKFDTLVCDCEGALYYILQDNENILKDIHTIIIENDFTDLNHKIYVDDVFKKFNLKCVYQKEGDNYVKAYLPCKQNFYEVWQK